MIIGRDEEHIFDDTRKSCPYLSEDYIITPKPYSFKVKNALGQERQYDIFYHIVPPMNKFGDYSIKKVPFGTKKGGIGIRTLGTREGTTVFKTAPINHSGIPPQVFDWFTLLYYLKHTLL